MCVQNPLPLTAAVRPCGMHPTHGAIGVMKAPADRASNNATDGLESARDTGHATFARRLFCRPVSFKARILGLDQSGRRVF